MTVPPELQPLTNFTAPPSLFPAARAHTLSALLVGGGGGASAGAGASRSSSNSSSVNQNRRVALRPVSRRLVASGMKNNHFLIKFLLIL